jgi:hypothetical protein
MRQFTTKKLIASGSLAVLLLILEMLTAVSNAITGNTVIAAPFSNIVYSALAIICLFLIDQFFSATIMFTVFGILALPFPLIGPAGFVFKIPILLVAGVICDSIYFILKKNRLAASLLIGGPLLYYFGITLSFLGNLFHFPGFEMVSRFVFSPIMLLGSLVIGAIGGTLGKFIYNKIEKTSVVRRIQK